MTTPMTAAEYRGEVGVPRTILGARLLAALEEREALLGEREEWGKISGQTIQDAAVGALVRRIGEHPMNKYRTVTLAGLNIASREFGLAPDSFRAALEYLDSLLPKEPEWVEGPSKTGHFRVVNGKLMTKANDREWEPLSVLVEDAAFVAKLVAKGGKDD